MWILKNNFRNRREFMDRFLIEPNLTVWFI